MSIHTLGILQVYAYIIGWWQYDLFYAVLRYLGIYYIPIGVIFGRAVIIPFLSQETRSAAVTAVKRLMVAFISVFFVLIFFVTPTMNFSIDSVNYIKNGHSYTVGQAKNDGGSFYGHFFDSSKLPSADGSKFTGVEIPFGWSVLINWLNVITAIGFDSMADGTISARNMSESMSYAAIKDPRLKAEVARFYKECYQPSYADYIGGDDNIAKAHHTEIARDVKKYGQDDLGWIGSHVMQIYYYPTYQAQSPVEGFPFDGKRDAIEGQDKNHPSYGQPMCNQWWSGASADQGQGLRDKLVNAMNAQIKQEGKFYNIGQWMDNHYGWVDKVFRGFSKKDAEDAAVHVMLEKQLHQEDNPSTVYYTEDATRGGMTSSFGRSIGTLGTIVDYNTTWSAYIDTFIKMLPVIQSMLIMGLIAFLPFGLVTSCFSFRFVFTMMFTLFSLVFCTYIWHFVAWVDNLFATALFHSNATGLDNVTDTLRRYFSSSTDPRRIVLDMAVCLAYVALPISFTKMCAAAGVVVGSGLDSMMSSGSQQSISVGNKGMKTASDVISMGASKYKDLKAKIMKG